MKKRNMALSALTAVAIAALPYAAPWPAEETSAAAPTSLLVKKDGGSSLLPAAKGKSSPSRLLAKKDGGITLLPAAKGESAPSRLLAKNDGGALIPLAAKGSPSRRAEELYGKAFTAYNEGKMIRDVGKRSEKYAEAIGAISEAASIEPENTEILILASSVYRAKGASKMAIDYFARAEATLLARLAREPEHIGANLDYAIISFAGEPRFGDGYAAWRKKAKKYADRVIKLTKKPAKSGDAPSMRAEGLAYLVKGDAERCAALLTEAAKGDADSRFYSGLFAETVAKGKWLWSVGAESVGKEFLMYCLTEPARYEKMPR